MAGTIKAITFEHKSSVPWLSKVYGICGIYNCPQLQIPYTLGSHCTYKCALNIRISEKEICQLHVNVLNRAWMNHCILQVLFCTRCVYTQHYSRCLCDFYTYSQCLLETKVSSTCPIAMGYVYSEDFHVNPSHSSTNH